MCPLVYITWLRCYIALVIECELHHGSQLLAFHLLFSIVNNLLHEFIRPKAMYRSVSNFSLELRVLQQTLLPLKGQSLDAHGSISIPSMRFTIFNGLHIRSRIFHIRTQESTSSVHEATKSLPQIPHEVQSYSRLSSPFRLLRIEKSIFARICSHRREIHFAQRIEKNRKVLGQ